MGSVSCKLSAEKMSEKGEVMKKKNFKRSVKVSIADSFEPLC